jgi:hypothetical protein
VTQDLIGFLRKKNSGNLRKTNPRIPNLRALRYAVAALVYPKFPPQIVTTGCKFI